MKSLKRDRTIINPMKRGLILTLLIGVILLYGCQQGGDGEAREGWKVGTEGLRIIWDPNFPPTRLYDDQPFQVLLDIENRGAHDVGGVGDKIYLSGFDSNIITGIPRNGKQIPDIHGIGPNSRGQGGFGTVEFEGIIRSLDFRDVPQYDPPILLTTCYGYRTVASGNVCIDPNPFRRDTGNRACVPRDVSLGGSQAAPIAVTNVEVEPSRGRTRFQIHISNVDNGDVFRPGAEQLADCSPFAPIDSLRDDLDFIRVEDVRVGLQSIITQCQPLSDGYLRLRNGQGILSCELANIDGNSATARTLTVELDYNYRQTQRREITIISSTR